MTSEIYIDKQRFINKYKIENEVSDEWWSELTKIFIDFTQNRKNFQSTADSMFLKFSNFTDLHSIRKRVKDPEHLIEKIIRKQLHQINLENYKSEITDLVGIRLLHLYKEDWQGLHEQILKMSKKQPLEISVKHRLGDDLSLYKKFENIQCEQHNAGYRSVHYLISSEFNADETHIVEVQVRTVFEEAWSEIDHHIRYPYLMENDVLNSFLLGFNTIAKSADDMGTFGLKLKRELGELNSIKNLKPQNSEGQNIEIVDSEFKAAQKTRDFDKKSFEGVWESHVIGQKSFSSKSKYYFKIVNDELLVPYSYAGDNKLTGEYFDIVFYRGLFFGKFQWFDQKDLFGYAFWEKIDERTLKGGWCLDDSVPIQVRSDVTRLNTNEQSFVPIQIDKISDGFKDFPEYVKDYFKIIEETIHEIKKQDG